MHTSIAHPGISLKPEFALDLTEKPLKILMYPQEVSTSCPPKNLFLVNFGSKNFKVFYFKWNLVRKCIQGSSFWIWQFSSQIPFPNYLFWGKFVPKLQSALFQMKLSTQGYSRVLILNLAFFFLYSVSETSFLGKFCLKTQKCFVLNQNCFQRVFRM